MRYFRSISVLLIVAMLLLICGCSAVDAQVKAIENAADDYEGSAFWIQGLKEQIQEQKSSDKDSASFDIEVTLPDYEQIDTADITYKAPDMDYSDPDACREALCKAIRTAMDAYVDNGDFDETTERTLTFDLEKDDGEWEAEIDQKDVAKMEKQIEEILSDKVDAFSPVPVELRMIELAEQSEDIANAVFSDPALAAACRISDIAHESGDTFAVTLSYPDVDAAFAQAGDDAFSGYSEAVFEAPEIMLWLDESYASAVSALPKKTGTCLVALPGSGVAEVTDAAALTAAIEDARSAAEKSAADRIYAKWVIQPVDPASAEEVIGAASGYKFEIDCRKAKSDYYFEFYQLDTNSLTSKQTFVFSVYIPAGKQRLDLRLLPGYYVVNYYWSDGPWYGTEYRFGPDGSSSFYGPFTAAKGYNYTLTMKW